MLNAIEIIYRPSAPVPAATEGPFVHPDILAEDPVLEIDHFNFWYGEKQALFDVSMRIPERKITAYIGPSGCGKSTLLRSINRRTT